MRNVILVLTVLLFSGSFALAACPSADLTGDCFVDYEDFALMANQWLTTDPCIPDDMVFIPGETFEMGDSLDEGSADELPVHTVTPDSFYMGKYEITNRQYCDYLSSAQLQGLITVTDGVVYKADSGTSYPYCHTHSADADSQIDYSGAVFSVRIKSGRDMSYDPMVQVSWYGAAAYCNWRSQEEDKEQCYDLSIWYCDFTKKGYRLATEAEWEYAARGGLSGRRFPWGDTISHSMANYYSYWPEGSPFYLYDVSPTEGYHPTWNDGVEPYTSAQSSFVANSHGLYDMAGNVWEWCNDWYDSGYYDYSPTSNPIGPTSGTARVIRGGGWFGYAYHCRVAYRFSRRTDDRNFSLGFRIVLDSSEPVCPSADLTGDCFVDFNDFAAMAGQWQTEGVATDPCNLIWVDINDPGVSGHEGFVGQMSKYETTNAQYCEFLNAALASGDIYVDSNIVYGSDGSNSGADFVDEEYFDTFAATDYSQITYSDGTFSVRRRDGYSMSDHPVVEVSWYGATAFCDYYGYRLPTEWEWQAVADFDGSYSYGCGTTINQSKANYDYANPLGLSSYPYTSPVDYYSSYGYGMNDMAGNVWEWTSMVNGSYRVLRGGSWTTYHPHLCSVSDRYTTTPHFTHYGGFRVCR